MSQLVKVKQEGDEDALGDLRQALASDLPATSCIALTHVDEGK